MKKILLNTVFILNLILLQSCDKEFSNPLASLKTDSRIVTPTDGTPLVLNANLFASPAMTVEWSSSDFSYSASVIYVLQIVKTTDNFDTPQVIPLGTFSENSNTVHQATISTSVLNTKLIATGTVIGDNATFKMRVFGQPSAQLASSSNGLKTYSQEVTFTATAYNPIDETPKIYVTGNFGSNSTFADWNINTNGTSNSPLIYSAAKDGKYSGFVYMNVASPQFKFANPDAISLNIKGVGTPYTSDKIDLDTAIAPGTLISSTDISTGNVITPSVTTTAGTYYVYADWTNNKYKIAKRLISLKGSTTQNTVKYLNFVTDNTSPYYRMYVATNVTLYAGSGYIQVKDNSSGSADKLERFGIDNTNTNLLVSPDATSSIKNKLKLGGQTQFNVNTPGTYTIVLDLRNSAVYSLRIIPN